MPVELIHVVEAGVAYLVVHAGARHASRTFTPRTVPVVESSLWRVVRAIQRSAGVIDASGGPIGATLARFGKKPAAVSKSVSRAGPAGSGLSYVEIETVDVLMPPLLQGAVTVWTAVQERTNVPFLSTATGGAMAEEDTSGTAPRTLAARSGNVAGQLLVGDILEERESAASTDAGVSTSSSPTCDLIVSGSVNGPRWFVVLVDWLLSPELGRRITAAAQDTISVGPTVATPWAEALETPSPETRPPEVPKPFATQVPSVSTAEHSGSAADVATEVDASAAPPAEMQEEADAVVESTGVESASFVEGPALSDSRPAEFVEHLASESLLLEGVYIARLDLVDEVVELKNDTPADLPLAGWKLCSETGSQEFKFPTDTVLPPGETVRVWSGKFAEDHHSERDLVWTKRFMWNNHGDTAVLINPLGVEVHSVSQGFASPDTANGTKAKDAADLDLVGGMISKLDLVDECVEISNTTSEPLCMGGWSLKSETGSQVFDFSADMVLQPGESLRVWSGRDADEHLGDSDIVWTRRFIWNNHGDTAILINPMGQVMDRVVADIQGGVATSAHQHVDEYEYAGLAVTSLQLEDGSVTLTNTATELLHLHGWVLKSERSNAKFKFPVGHNLEPGDSVTIWSGKGSDVKHEPPSNLFWTKRHIWSKKGATAVLLNPHGDVAARFTVAGLP